MNAAPQPGPYDWLARPVPNRKSHFSLHANARGAIYWAIRGLQLAPDTAVKMPAFHCGVEVQAVLDAGLKIEFYQIRRDLTIDLDNLKEKLERRPGPVFVIHYFGLPQPEIGAVERMCAAARQPWLEDCAHALYAETRAPLAVFSFAKTLPLLEGGALTVDRQQLGDLGLTFAPPPKRRASWRPYRFYAREMIRSLAGDWPVQMYSRLFARQPTAPAAGNPMLLEPTRYWETIAAVSRRIAASSDPASVIEKRRANWIALDAILAGARGYCRVFENLPDGVCPLFLAIRASQRDALLDAFAKNGVDTSDFGSSPHPHLAGRELADSAELRREILCLPVQQQLTGDDIRRLAQIALPLLEKYG